MSASEWRKSRPTIAPFFDSNWRHKRIDEEIAKADEVSSKRKASAKERWSKRNANALQLDTQSQSHTQKKEKEEDAPDGAPSKYFFESGVIRLSEKDFRKWRESFSNLDLRAELIGLAQWAEQQKDWFFAVSGALAKRNREIGIALKTQPQRPESRVII